MFSYCDSLTNVYYTGSEEEWSKITIGGYNDRLIDTIRYYYSETEPDAEGNFWHYDDSGKIVIW
jgi:hypothetical protein